MPKKIRVAIVGTNGLPAAYGGFETLVDYLTKYNNTDLIEFTVFCSKTKKSEQLTSYNNARLIYLSLSANGGQSILYDFISLLKVWFTYDRVLLLGTSGALIIPFLKLFKNTKLITNFGGLEWKRDKWKWWTRRFLKISEAVSIKFSNQVIADNQTFVDYIQKEYGKDSILIEYGGDHVENEIPSKELIEKYQFLTTGYGISISRAQPDNQIHVLLEAYKNSVTKDKLVVISNWNKFEYGRALKNEYSNIENLYLLDAVYDLKVLNVLRSNAKYYIHTHSFCGTAPSLVEAMNHKLPIISYDAPTNISTTENKAVFFNTSSDLTNILNSIDSFNLNQNSNDILEIAKRRYTWKIIANKYFKLILKK